MPLQVSQIQKKQRSPEEEKKAEEEVHQRLQDYYIRSTKIRPINMIEERAAISALQKADPTDFQEIAASKLTLSTSYADNALSQSQQSFHWAIIYSVVSAIFIITTALIVIFLRPELANSIMITLLGGTGGIRASSLAQSNFQLYKYASDHKAACHARLDRTSDFILAYSISEGLDGAEKKQKKSEIISKLIE